MDPWRHQPIEPGWLQLGPGERVLWTGKPGLRARYADSFEWMVIIGWLGVAGFLGVNVIGRWRDLAGGGYGSWDLVSALMLSALTAGIAGYATVGRWLQARSRNERILYALTNRRAAIRDENAPYPVTERRLTPDMELWPSIGKDGRGTLSFATIRPPSIGSRPAGFLNGRYGLWTYQVNGREFGEFRFEGLERADQVLALMAEAVTVQMSDNRHPRPPRWVTEGRRYGARPVVQDD